MITLMESTFWNLFDQNAHISHETIYHYVFGVTKQPHTRGNFGANFVVDTLLYINDQ